MTFDGAVALGVVTVGLFLAWKYSGKLDAAASAINPVNNNNAINTGVNAALGYDNKTSSLGSQIYDWLHPNESEKLGLKTVKPAAVRVTR